jgi:hypothetical protein
LHREKLFAFKACQWEGTWIYHSDIMCIGIVDDLADGP